VRLRLALSEDGDGPVGNACILRLWQIGAMGPSIVAGWRRQLEEDRLQRLDQNRFGRHAPSLAPGSAIVAAGSCEHGSTSHVRHLPPSPSSVEALVRSEEAFEPFLKLLRGKG